MQVVSKRLLVTKTPRFLQKIEYSAAKEQQRDKLTVKHDQSNKAKPKNIGKAIKGREMLPEVPYINFMDENNKVFLGDSFSSRA